MLVPEEERAKHKLLSLNREDAISPELTNCLASKNI